MDRRADKIVCAAARTAIQAASTDHARATGLNGVLGTHRVSKDMERDYFMTPEEAREYGIIDRVLSHR